MRLHFEHEKIRMRQPGDCWIVTMVAGEPLCVVRITNVDIKPFNRHCHINTLHLKDICDSIPVPFSSLIL